MIGSALHSFCSLCGLPVSLGLYVFGYRSGRMGHCPLTLHRLHQEQFFLLGTPRHGSFVEMAKTKLIRSRLSSSPPASPDERQVGARYTCVWRVIAGVGPHLSLPLLSAPLSGDILGVGTSGSFSFFTYNLSPEPSVISYYIPLTPSKIQSFLLYPPGKLGPQWVTIQLLPFPFGLCNSALLPTRL